ncbi:MAG: hypothetical protein GX957_08670 [Clostridiaceae bacterium]|nr:hypothetical protein [Clostridiaceae bacterium]
MFNQNVTALYFGKLNNDKEQLITNIQTLKEKMVKLGYNPGEVDYLLARYGINSKMEELDYEVLKIVEKKIVEHLNFARQCMNIR